MSDKKSGRGAILWGGVFIAVGLITLITSVNYEVSEIDVLYAQDLENKAALAFFGALVLILGALTTIGGFILRAIANHNPPTLDLQREEQRSAIMSKPTLAILFVAAVALIGGLLSYQEHQSRSGAELGSN